jgi:hypothetical protein
MKPRGIETHRLVEILQSLQLARKTGWLAVERVGANDTIEQGTITFSNGQIVHATLHPYDGPKAFALISAWTTCYFTFHSSQVEKPTSPSHPSTAPSFTHVADPRAVPAAPYRTRSVDEIMTTSSTSKLTRVHRQLFLLINGKRTIQDFVRLTGHIPEEVETLLLDLERAGFIRR